MRTTGITGGLQIELAGGVARQDVPRQYSVGDQLTVPRCHALVVEGGAAHGLRQVWSLGDGKAGGKHLFTRRIQQERGLPVLAAAADGGGEMADETARDFRHEQHRRAPGGQLARVQPRDGATGTLAADRLGIFQLPPVARAAVPIIALHVLARTREHHAAQGMRRRRVAADEAVGIAVNVQALMGADRATFRIVDARIERQRRRLAGLGEFDGLVRRDGPGKGEIEVGRRMGHQSGFRETRTGVFGRESRDAAGLGHGVAHRFQGEIRGAGRPLAPAEIHRDPHAAVTLVFQGFHFAESHADRKTSILTDRGFCLGRASRAGILQSALDDGLQVSLGKA